MKGSLCQKHKKLLKEYNLCKHTVNVLMQSLQNSAAQLG